MSPLSDPQQNSTEFQYRTQHGDCNRFRAWTSRWGNNLDGVFEEELCELLDPDLRDYLHQMVKGGVPARQPLAQVRVPSKPHASVQGHMEEAMEKLWKDAKRGRVLLCGKGSEPYLNGVLSSPWGRVPKMNPDRTVSSKGRLVWDAKSDQERSLARLL